MVWSTIQFSRGRMEVSCFPLPMYKMLVLGGILMWKGSVVGREDYGKGGIADLVWTQPGIIRSFELRVVWQKILQPRAVSGRSFLNNEPHHFNKSLRSRIFHLFHIIPNFPSKGKIFYFTYSAFSSLIHWYPLSLHTDVLHFKLLPVY